MSEPSQPSAASTADESTAPADESTAAEALSLRLRQLIHAEMEAAGGALPFDRFMELALYAPGLGYYAAGSRKLGADGDFVTAPEISPLFGRCLASQCAEGLAALDGGDVLEFGAGSGDLLEFGAGSGDLLELGAGSGAMAAQLMQALAEMDRLPGRYLILEPSPDLAARQRSTIARLAPGLRRRVHWVTEPPADLRGLILANEVLDAMPVHRFCLPPLAPDAATGGADIAAAVQEVLVRADGDGFVEAMGNPVSTGLAEAVAALDLPPQLLARGLCSEINLRLGPWLGMLAHHLAAGMVLLVDYGYPRSEFYLPERSSGTLLCHHRHRAHADPYAHLGLQDITAHVDFSAVAAAGNDAGLELAGYTTQANFLLGCGLDRHLSQAAADPEALLQLAAGAKQLVLPTAMGERFQVIAFSRNLPAPADGWCGFALRDLRGRL